MDQRESTISTTRFNGTPLVTVCGSIDGWRAQSLENVVEDHLSQGTTRLTLDVTHATFSDVESSSILIRMLRTSSTEMRTTVIASGATASMLKRAGLEPSVTICANMDHAVESVRPEPEYLTSRWIAQTAYEDELPLAA